MKSEKEFRQDIVEVGRRVWEKGYVASNDGNISARISETEVVATPTGVSKGFLTPEMLVKVDMEGRVLEGDLQPSSEIKMHLSIYREREDVCGVVHAHPPTATGFAVAGLALDRPTLPEVVVSLKAIPLAEYGTPSTDELPETIKPYLRDYDAFLLANHGTLTVGKDLEQAYYRLETIEHCAQITLTARLLGTEQTLTAPQVQRLLELREEMGLGERESCLGCGICEATESSRRFVESCGSRGAMQTMEWAATDVPRERKEGASPARSVPPAGSTPSVAGSSLNAEELREIVTRVAREVLASEGSGSDNVWRE